MATYKEKVGTAVTNNAGAFPGAADGELWFNSTASTFQYQYSATVDAWSTGGNLNTGRMGVGGAGIQTAAIGFGGYPPGSPKAKTELYNGSTWTEVNDMVGGTRYDIKGTGTQTAALAFGGGAAPLRALTETWNGTNWTEVTNMSTARGSGAFAGGTNTAGIAAGGNSPPLTANTELYNGTNWTEVNNMNLARQGIGSAAYVSQTAGLAFGGEAPSANKNETELWNGTN